MFDLENSFMVIVFNISFHVSFSATHTATAFLAFIYIRNLYKIIDKIKVMKRYDIFYRVHSGLRAMLYETSLCLQQTDFSNAEDADKSLEQLEIVMQLFDKHAHTEDTIVFAAIKQTEPSLLYAFEKEHVEDHALVQSLIGLVASFNLAASANQKMVIGKTIVQSFTEFMIFNLRHMAKEENLINNALWKYYSDEELHGITEKIIANITPAQMAMYSTWMMRGLSNNEISNWLKEVKNSAPDFLFQSLMQTAAKELNKHRWQLVQEAITDGAMVA
jgi:hemerythrin-like domain-containing protein